ncbi:MAG: hypothetical protein KDD63_27105, partial [Bacteroidetes bacterium]|nr:hypothetical protein [Bacteroidota bacterium]
MRETLEKLVTLFPITAGRIILIIVFVIFYFLFWGGDEQEQEEGKVLFENSEEGVQVESFGVEYLFSDSARVSAQLI